MGHRMDRMVRFVSHHHHLVQLYVVVVVLLVQSMGTLGSLPFLSILKPTLD
jgi:hypothetical protein